jgi:hypothetical protein
MHDERVQIVGQAPRRRCEAAVVELVGERLESLLGVALIDGVIERLPVRALDAFALAFGQLRVAVARPMHAAALAVRRRPALLDRLDEPGSAVGDDQHRRPEPSCDQVTAERLPVLVGLAHPEHHLKQHALAVCGEAPGHQHALFRPTRTHGDEGRVQKQRHQPDLVEAATRERLEALAELLADP